LKTRRHNFRPFIWKSSLAILALLPWGCTSELSPHPDVEAAAQLIPGPLREIRILTINVWSGLTYKGFFKIGQYQDDSEKRFGLLVKEIRKIQPDVIAIQEANPLPSYAQVLAKNLNYQFIYRVALGGIRFGSLGIPTNLREGEVILVRKPWSIVDLDRKHLGGNGIATNWFCLHFGDFTQVIFGQAEIDGKRLYVYAVHLHSGPFRGPSLDNAVNRMAQEMPRERIEEARKDVERTIKRRRQEIDTLKEFIDATLPPGMPAILLGDFNTTVESGELDSLLTDGKWVDSYRIKNPKGEGATWDPFRNPNFRRAEVSTRASEILHTYHEQYPSRIDFIFVRNSIPRENILESGLVLTPENGFCASDHYGVLTVLKW
jgi:endonuclease/exonuclease/phosphatase family metal-dependent hydrolase